jgi:hypothetical protein
MALFPALILAGALQAGPPQIPPPFPPPRPTPQAPQRTAETLRVFLDCQTHCDFDFFRTEIAFVNFVRDRKDADLHILITSERTGSGGSEYTFQFIGLGGFAALQHTLHHTSDATATDDEVRRGQLRVIRLGIASYAAYTPQGERLDVQFKPDSAQKKEVVGPTRDPWNLWYFRTRLNGNFSGEELSSRYSLGASVSANRTTEAWKVNLSLNGNYNESSYTLSDDSEYVSITRSFTWSGLAAKSLNPQWSAGVKNTVSGSTYRNQDLYVRLAPGIEYDFFPYSESTRRRFTIQWTIGADYYDYIEETVYLKTTDTLFDHTLIASLDLTQPWGSTSFAFEAAQFLNDPSKYRLTLFGSADVRLFKGFSFNVFGDVERIRDQIYLPRGEATDEEILVRQRQLQTGYSYFFGFGVSYSFGSKYQNVVNPRFGGSSGGVFIMY